MDTHIRARLARTGLVAGLAVAFVPIIGISPAHACSCVESSEQDRFKRADVVFKGTLPGGTGTGGNGSEDIVLTFDATRVYKGTAVARQKVRTSGSGASCGLELSGAGPFLVFSTLPRDEEGKRLPAAADPEDQVLEANLCGGTRPIGADEHPSFGTGRPIEQKPVDGPGGNSGGDADGVGGAYGLFGAVLGTIIAVLGSLLGWTDRH